MLQNTLQQANKRIDPVFCSKPERGSRNVQLIQDAFFLTRSPRFCRREVVRHNWCPLLMADASNEIQAQALVKNTPDERRSVQTSFAACMN